MLQSDGWFSTGDLGLWLPDGDLAVIGRHKEMIIRSGFNVHPAEVDQPARMGDETVVTYLQLRDASKAAEAPKPASGNSRGRAWRPTNAHRAARSSTPCRWGPRARFSSGNSLVSPVEHQRTTGIACGKTHTYRRLRRRRSGSGSAGTAAATSSASDAFAKLWAHLLCQFFQVLFEPLRGPGNVQADHAFAILEQQRRKKAATSRKP